jgi:propionyl-CoA carboxylase beta chain
VIDAEPGQQTATERHKVDRWQTLEAEIAAQHDGAATEQAGRGKRGARERVLALLDAGTFQELDPFVRHRAHELGMARTRPWGDGVVTDVGLVEEEPTQLILSALADERI